MRCARCDFFKKTKNPSCSFAQRPWSSAQGRNRQICMHTRDLHRSQKGLPRRQWKHAAGAPAANREGRLAVSAREGASVRAARELRRRRARVSGAGCVSPCISVSRPQQGLGLGGKRHFAPRCAPPADGVEMSDSRRTTPYFSSHSSSDRRQHVSGPSLRPPGIFEALDNASWADVRRAIAADPAALASPKTPSHGARPCPPGALLPLDYALHLAAESSAILDHCDRTGFAHGAWPTRPGSTLTLRDRRAALAQICLRLVSSYEQLPPPGAAAVHIALRTRLAPLCFALLGRYPHLASGRARPSRKTALHALASSFAASAPSSWSTTSVALADAILKSPAVSAADVDADGRTCLHDLCSALSSASPPYGLRSPRPCASAPGVSPLIDLFIKHGALPCSRDRHGASPISIALQSVALDCATLTSSADKVFRNITNSTGVLRRRGACPADAGSDAPLAKLPEDVQRLIFTMISPKEAVCGLGATSRHFRRVATCGDLWQTSLSVRYTRAHAQQCARRVVRQP